MDDQAGAWLDTELDGCDLADQRLTKRLRNVLTQLGGAMGQSIPLACQDWANTKAAYRFISNDRVSEAEILAGHFWSTGERVAAHDGLILMLHDTTEFSYRRERPEAIGITKSINSGKDKEGRLRTHTVCGILPDQDRQARRLSRSGPRSASWQHGHAARHDASDRHPVRRHDWSQTCG